MSVTPELIISSVGSSQQRKRDEPIEDFLDRIVQLSLNEKHLKELAGIEECPKLRILYVRNNRITTISHMNHQLLTHLDLQYNYIEKLDGLQGCPALKHLYLSFNCISEIVSLEGPVALEVFNYKNYFFTLILIYFCLNYITISF